MKYDHDIIIIGGGAVGLTLASALCDSHLTIAIVDYHTADQRVSAITRASQRIFESLGVWSDICQQGISPYKHMEVWETGGAGHIAFDSMDVGEPTLGHIIQNSVLQTALLAKLEACENLQFITPVKLTGLESAPDRQIVQLSNGQQLSCRLVIGADGSQSSVRNYSGIEITQRDYGQSALVTTVRTALPHQETARQIFLPDGPLAFLPLADSHLCSIVWSTLPDHADQLLQMDLELFKKNLADAFEHRLGAIESATERLSFPLHMQHAYQYVKPGIALIGDAAHSLHPLAGQGMNLGLLDAACLAEVLLDAWGKKRDIASLLMLRRYERWRKGNNLAMIAAMQGFKSLFASQQPWVQQIRRWGLEVTNSTPFVKHLFMRYAMGLVGDLPELAR